MRYQIDNKIVDTETSELVCQEREPGRYGHIYKKLYRTRKGFWWTECWHSWSEDNHQLDFVTETYIEDAALAASLAGCDLSKYPELQACDVEG